ncbi:MAG TPA: DUF4384 domain-containing protein [Gemmatimonadales bacterium]|nr:DUF4384 domain-containing protein [Gemmatimonadales bacterium]
MFPALIIAASLLATPGVTPAVAASDPDPAVRLWLNNDRSFEAGDRAKVQVQTRDDGYLVVFQVDIDGHLRVLFPLDPGDDNYVRGGHRYALKGRGGREAFSAEQGSGRGWVYAAVSRLPFRFDDYVRGDHWDYGAFPEQLPEQPEDQLNELAQRIATDRFDYDILSYDVYQPTVASYGAASTTVYSSYYPSYYDPFWPTCLGCYGSGLTVSIGFGRRYPYYWYDPAFIGPYVYDPFYYYPYRYYPYYYRPARYYYYPPAYRYPYASYGPRYGHPSSVWTFKSIDRATSGIGVDYRDRRYLAPRTVRSTVTTPSRRRLEPTEVRTSPAPRTVNAPRTVDAPRTVNAPREQVEPRRRTSGEQVSPSRREAQPQVREVRPETRSEARDDSPRRAAPERERNDQPRAEPVRPEYRPEPSRQAAPERRPAAEPSSRPAPRMEPSRPASRPEPARVSAPPQRSSPPPRAAPSRGGGGGGSAPARGGGGRRRP